MKLRIRGNSLRLRLSQSEVGALASTGRVEERVEFSPTSSLAYAIEARADATAVGAELSGTRVTIVVPTATVRRFAESDDVGFDAAQGPLKILVEKDWQCLKPRTGEDDADAYPHPEEPAKT